MTKLDFFTLAKTAANCERPDVSWEPRLELCTQCKWSISAAERTRKVMCRWKLHGMKVCYFHLNCGSRLQGSMWGVHTLAWNLQRVQGWSSVYPMFSFFSPLWVWNSPIPAVHLSKLVLNIRVPSHKAGPFPAFFFFLLVFISPFTLFMMVCLEAIHAAKLRYSEGEIFPRSSEACCLQHLHLIKQQVVL